MNFKRELLKLRLYQETILATAAQHNTLVVIPTGLGKTMIAIALASLQKKKVLFLAPTKPLCVQHENSFRQFFDADSTDIATLTGAVQPSERKKLWANAKIVFSTPQTAENDLLRRLFLPEDFSLLVIDEAHRATGDYAYVWLAKQFNKYSTKILALTASPASEKEKLDEVRTNLCIEKIEVRTEENEDVKPYIKKKEIRRIEINLSEDYLLIKSTLEASLKSRLTLLKELGIIESADINRARKVEFLRLQGMLASQNEPELFKAISVIASCIKLMHAVELLETQGARPLVDFLASLQKQKSKAAKNLLMDWNIKKAIALADKHSSEHPKFEELRKIVEENVGRKIIVFAQYRNGVEKIVKALEQIKGAKPIAFVGQKEGMTQKKQVEIIEKFKRNEHNILVCTSVAEEGLDIPSVPVAIFFESVPSALRSIQRRGRVGRTDVGQVYLLITKGTIDEKYYWVARHKEKRMGQILKDLSKEASAQQNLNSFTV